MQASVVLLLLGPAEAKAYEDQVGLGLDAGYAVVLGNADLPAHGIPFGLTFWWGLGDTFQLQGRIGYAPHPDLQTLHVGVASAEILYLLDLMQVVPFAGVGADLLYLRRGSAAAFEPAFHLLVGLDYLIDRRWIAGLDIRPFVLPLEIPARGFSPVYLTASLRLTLAFDR